MCALHLSYNKQQQTVPSSSKMGTHRGAAPHVLALPFPAQGRITPMLSFSHLLAARGIVVTFLNTEKTHTLMQLEVHSQQEEEAAEGEEQKGIRFEVIPDGSQEPLPGSQPSFQVSNLLKGMESRQGVIEEIVVRSRATPQPITCIISDSFFPWTCSLARKLGIQRVLFWTSNGATLASAVELKSGKLRVSGDNEITAGVPIAQSEFFSALPRQDPENMKLFMERMTLEDTTCIVVNTFEELEGSSLEACASCETKVHYIGPVVPLGNHKGASNISFYKEESSCIEWLDKQAPRSVLYVSFGSIASLASQELEELAFGIEESKQAFLWVLRDSNQSFLQGFLDRTCDRGLVVKWAPQIKVLGHVAVGAFLTHCGWNSVLESISAGVPMLCYPMIHDQHLNALLITRIWKLGIGLSKEGQNGLITREEIQRCVSSILSSEELHLKLSTWKGLANRTLQQGGSSYCALEQFIDTLRSYTY